MDINIKNVSGIIKVNDIKGIIKLNSSTGDIFINEIDGSSDIETIPGNIKINNFKISDNSKIYTTSGEITIKVDNESNCKLKYSKNSNYVITKNKCKNGKNALSIKDVTGNVLIK